MIMCESAIAPPQFHLFWREGRCMCLPMPITFELVITKAEKMNPQSAISPKWNSNLLPKSSVKFGVH